MIKQTKVVVDNVGRQTIGELNDYVKKLEQVLDEIEKYMTTYIKVEDGNENVKIEFNELLKIIQKAKGDVKNENNNV